LNVPYRTLPHRVCGEPHAPITVSMRIGLEKKKLLGTCRSLTGGFAEQ
jgi:hypothetical protein